MGGPNFLLSQRVHCSLCSLHPSVLSFWFWFWFLLCHSIIKQFWVCVWGGGGGCRCAELPDREVHLVLIN